MSKKIDQAISIIEFLLKKKKKRIEEYSRKSVTTENEKIFIGDETQMIDACLVGSGMRRAAPALEISDGQRETLTVLSRSRTAPVREVQRARALLLAADGVANYRVAR